MTAKETLKMSVYLKQRELGYYNQLRYLSKSNVIAQKNYCGYSELINITLV